MKNENNSPSDDAGAGSSSNQMRIENSMPAGLRSHYKDVVNHLLENGIHPVLVFGTNASGKTTMLQSLIYYARRHSTKAKMEILLGENIFPRDFPQSKELYRSAVEFFQVGLRAFEKQNPPAPTQKETPFFVPIDVIIDNKEKERIRFAFLEGMGEWYETKGVEQPVTADSPSIYRDFQPIVKEILETFSIGLSVIIVAPAVSHPNRKKEFSHDCMENVIDDYSAARLNKHQDNLLFLLSKWDALCDPSENDSHFSTADSTYVLEKIGWSSAWARVAALTGLQEDAKVMMPYSAAWINEGKIVNPGPYKPAFDKFNRTIWNWLYGNALLVKSVNLQQGETGSERKNLFEDVVPQKSATAGFFWKLNKMLLWVR